MLEILYLLLMVFTFLFVKIYFEKETFTAKEEEEIKKKLSKLEKGYTSIEKKLDDQQKTMKSASDQAAAAKASISAAKF
jgi:predicted  nucleic acid-binding Zn-ribbon protein